MATPCKCKFEIEKIDYEKRRYTKKKLKGKYPNGWEEALEIRLLIDMGIYKTQREITVEEYFKKNCGETKR